MNTEPSTHEPSEGRAAGPGLREIPITAGLIAACVGVAFATKMGEDLAAVSRFLFTPTVDLVPGGDPLRAIREGELYRLLTPIFIHFGALHAVFNLVWLKELGGLIERFRGSAVFLTMVVVIGLLSNYAQFALGGPSVFGGMSGVVYGLFGYVWIRGNVGRDVPFRLPSSTVLIMLGWLVLCFTGLVGSVANFAHLGGLVAGMISGGVGVLRARRSTPVTEHRGSR